MNGLDKLAVFTRADASVSRRCDRPPVSASGIRTRQRREANSKLRFREFSETFLLYRFRAANWPGATADNGRFTVGRARLAPAMISTTGHRASRRRQREALPAWCKVIGAASGYTVKSAHNPASVRFNAAPNESGSPGTSAPAPTNNDGIEV